MTLIAAPDMLDTLTKSVNAGATPDIVDGDRGHRKGSLPIATQRSVS